MKDLGNSLAESEARMFGIINKIAIYLVGHFRSICLRQSTAKQQQLFQELYTEMVMVMKENSTQSSSHHAPTTLLHTFAPASSGLEEVIMVLAPEP